MSGRQERGFSLLEVLVGLTILSSVMAALGIFYRGQVAGLQGSSELSDGTQVALTHLERVKNRLSDRSAFGNAYRDTEHGPSVSQARETFNHGEFLVTIRLDRAPAPLYALRATTEVAWKRKRRVELGVLVPGPSPTL